MPDEEAIISEAMNAPQAESKSKETRERSTIDFPYMPLESAIEVAKAIYHRSGFESCDQDELAAEMGQTISGAFRQKTSAARTFGFVAKDGRSAFILTDLGKKAVSAETERAAAVEAFLNVPLYQAIYDKHRGHNLPPPKALERVMESLGVASKQTDRARQAFDRSAQFAGFFESGKERLVKPRIEAGATVSIADKDKEENRGVVSESNAGARIDTNSQNSESGLLSDIDPIIAGLIARLPKTGAEWPKEERKLWLGILENSFELVYVDNSSSSDSAVIYQERNTNGQNE